MEIRNSNYQVSFKKAVIKKGVDELMQNYDKQVIKQNVQSGSSTDANLGSNWKTFKKLIEDKLEKTKYHLVLSKEGSGADSKIGVTIENKSGNIVEKKYVSTINSDPYEKIAEGFDAVKALDVFSK